MADEAKVKVLFEKYDGNKNGVLDRQEFSTIFRTLLEELGENFPDKKHDQVEEEAMQNFDLNQNGVIEYDEFVELINFLVTEKGYSLK